MTPLVNSPYAYGNLYGALNTRCYTLVQGFGLFWRFLMEGKGLKTISSFYTLVLTPVLPHTESKINNDLEWV